MGNGASCTKVEQFDESSQIPSPIKRSSTSSSIVQPYRTLVAKPPTISPVEEEEGFAVKTNTDQYSSVWDYNAKVGL